MDVKNEKNIHFDKHLYLLKQYAEMQYDLLFSFDIEYFFFGTEALINFF